MVTIRCYTRYGMVTHSLIYFFYVEQIIRIPATSMKPLKDFEDCVTQTEVNPLTAIDVFLRCLIMCIEVPMKINLGM